MSLSHPLPSFHEITVKSLLRRFRRIDSWFIAKAGLNLYRGCAHDCAYCDGRAEKYGVPGDFGADVSVKSNAIEILRGELGAAEASQAELWPQKRPWIRADLAGGFVMVGGGVGDSYQPVEAKALAARRALELFEELSVPVHILTKSALVLRDADVIERISRKAGALVSFSISSSEDSIGSELEPGASLPSRRLSALAALRRRGIAGGVFLLPVIPFISDSPDSIEKSVDAAVAAGAQYVLFGGMTLKPGRQREHFLSAVGSRRPGLPEKIGAMYPTDGKDAKWGNAASTYHARIGRIFGDCSRRRLVPPRIPRQLFSGTVEGIDLIVVLLDQIHAMLEMEGRSSPFGREASRIARLPSPLDPDLLAGSAAPLVREILTTGTCSLYESLMPPCPVT